MIRAFYFTSYGTNWLTEPTVTKQLDALPTGTTHAILTVHVCANGNRVSRTSISENPDNLAGWFRLVRERNIQPALAMILFDGEWGWAGWWRPSRSALALKSYYVAVRPYVQEAQKASLPFVILCDEWSTLFARKSAVPAFATLFASARADYSGLLALNVSNMEEGDIVKAIPALTDFMGINAYIPLSTINKPSGLSLATSLTGPSSVPSVKSLVNGWRDKWGDPSVVGYMTYIRHLAALWDRPILFTTGYKSTVGAARDPSGQAETTPDNQIQSDCWDAFKTAAKTTENMGIAVWRWWPGAADDDGATGFSPQGKICSETMWK